MTAVRCAELFEGLIIRMISLTSCGVPVSGGSSSVIIMDGFTKVMSTAQYNNGTRITTRKANGTLCLNRKPPDQFTHAEVVVDFCTVHPGVPVFSIGGRLLTASESPTGTGFAVGNQLNGTPPHFSLELWQPPPDECGTGTIYYPYWAWPHLSDGKLGAVEVSAEAQTLLHLTANTFPASPLWTAGNPYLGQAPASGDGFLYNLQNQAPPPTACTIAAYP